MAGVAWKAVTAQVATGTSAKTILQVKALSNHRIHVKEWGISFEGTSNSAAPIQVRLLRQTSAGTMTSLTVVKGNAGDDETLQVTAQHTATVEPSPSDVIDSVLVHPQTGYTWQAPYGEEIPVVGGGYLGIEVTAPAGVDCIATMKGYE